MTQPGAPSSHPDPEVLEHGNVTSPEGFLAGGVHCGLRRKRLDFGWLYSAWPATAAAVYTTNRFQAAPLTVTRESVEREGLLQAVVVNSANANSCTGEQGLKDARQTRALVAEKLGLPTHRVAVSSTGVIGVPLPMDKIAAAIGDFSLSRSSASDFEQAILTTDLVPKSAAVRLEIAGRAVTIGGSAKGSGMIHPNMATMLAFLTTDAQVERGALQAALTAATGKTFNMISVDGDSSTNDQVLLLANGAAQTGVLDEAHPDWDRFVAALTLLCEILAKKIARDGEGATKLVEVQVTGAADEEEARTVARTVAASSLVKTAVHGADPNWGRIVCAAGYSGAPLDPDTVSVQLGPIAVVDRGLPLPFDEAEGKAYLQASDVLIRLQLGRGDAGATAWGCDLSYEYVRINASYRS